MESKWLTKTKQASFPVVGEFLKPLLLSWVSRGVRAGLNPSVCLCSLRPAGTSVTHQHNRCVSTQDKLDTVQEILPKDGAQTTGGKRERFPCV